MRHLQTSMILTVCWLVCVGAIFGQSKPTEQQLAQDLQQFAVELPKRYTALFDKRSNQEFADAIDKLRVRLSHIDLDVFKYELQKIATMFTNGRVHLDMGAKLTPLVSVRFKVLGDGVYVSATEKKHAHLLESKLIRISGMDAETFVKAIGEYVPHKNNLSGLRRMADGFSAEPTLLRAMGLVKNGNISVTVESDRKEVTFEVDAYPTINRYPRISFAHNSQWYPRLTQQTPRWLRSSEEGILYFNLVKCRTESELRLFIKRTEKLLSQHKVKSLAIELRSNILLGPRERERKVATELIDYLGNHKVFNRPGKLFAIVGRETLPSGFINLSELRDKTNVIFVGEEPGTTQPIHYAADFDSFVLGNTGVKVRHFVGTQLSTIEAAPEHRPDISIELTSKNWFGGRDPFIVAIEQHGVRN